MVISHIHIHTYANKILLQARVRELPLKAHAIHKQGML